MIVQRMSGWDVSVFVRAIIVKIRISLTMNRGLPSFLKMKILTYHISNTKGVIGFDYFWKT